MAITCWPKGVLTSPASRSGTMITLSDVATRITATSSGVLINPTSCSGAAIAAAIMKPRAKQASPRSSTSPRSLLTSISRPARNRSAASPTVEKSSTGWLEWAMSRTCGPTMIPPSSSSTIAGTKSFGISSRRTGAVKAITATTTKLKSGI